VHSLADSGFAERDRAGAHAFADAANGAGLTQVVYLGGLGDDDDELSPHLRSRREAESILLRTAPTTALRAGIVIGDGGISWEILRQLVERLPVMVTPRWVEARSQPSRSSMRCSTSLVCSDARRRWAIPTRSADPTS
jgi:uncharacterized protein YbjT (DUF2867 family)